MKVIRGNDENWVGLEIVGRKAVPGGLKFFWSQDTESYLLLSHEIVAIRVKRGHARDIIKDLRHGEEASVGCPGHSRAGNA